MELYLGRPLDRKEVVHHIDGDRTNNRIENLQLTTTGEHNLIHDKRYPGSRNPMAKLTEQQVIEIRRLKGVLNMDQVARKFGVSPSRICTIWKGTGWKTLTK